MSDTITCEWCAEEIPAASSRCPKCQGSISRAGQRVQGTPLATKPPVPTKPKAPAGWYDHPTMADTRRYWDGQKWTDHIAPGAASGSQAPGTDAPVSGSRDETAFAWTLAVLPVAWIVLYITAPKAAISPWAWGGLIALSLLLSTLDARGVRARGHDEIGTAAGWGIPFYLIERTKKVGSSAFIPIIWFAGVGGAILTYFVAPGVYDIDGAALSSQIQGQFQHQTSTTATVHCPNAHHVTKGDTLTCTVEGAAELGTEIQVSFNGDGSYTWQLAR